MSIAPLPANFRLRDGSTLRGGQVAFETWGRLNAGRDNAILLFTGLSPSAHAAATHEDASPGWWEAFIGPGRALDTDRWFIVCLNSLGSCFGSTGPASIEAATGERWRLRFPPLAVEDIACAGRECLRTLGIESLHAVIGPSLGGLSALAFVAQFRGFARNLVTICSAAAASPMAIALRAIQREAILNDPAWRGGDYPPDAPPVAGLRLARKLGTTTYRSAQEWNARFGRRRIDAAAPERHHSQDAAATLFGPEFEVEGYLAVQAERFAARFDANCYLYLSRAMDRFQLDEHAANGELPALFAASGLAAALVVGVESDALFPIEEQTSLAAALNSGGVATTFVRLDSIEGHDAFLIDVDAFAPVLRRFLS